MSAMDRLTTYFSEFPGIGPRQARRFVGHLLTRRHAQLDELSALIQDLKSETARCRSCGRFFVPARREISECFLCADANRDDSKLLVVAKDIDIETIERSGGYDGRYFVLAGTVPILAEEPERHIRIRELTARLADTPAQEIIIALPANPEGDNTARVLIKILGESIANTGSRITMLGRGLSTGLEIEYSDTETIKNALTNRH